MPSGVYERTKKGNQNISKAKKRYWAGITKEKWLEWSLLMQKAAKKRYAKTSKKERLQIIKAWCEAGGRATKERFINMTEEEKWQTIKKCQEAGVKATKRKYANMTKKQLLKYLDLWIKAGQMAAQKINSSSIEKLIWKELNELEIEYETQVSFNHGKFIVDIYISSQRTIIECNGTYWHNLLERKERDKKLRKYAKDNNYKLIELWEFDIRKNPKQALENGFKTLVNRV